MLKKQGNSIFTEAHVLSVDIKRGACKCRTIEGKYLSNVTWMRPVGSHRESGENHAPIPGEYVYICFISSLPVIVGSLALLGYGSTLPSSISEGEHSDKFERDFNLAVVPAVNRSGGSFPEDQVPGDRVVTNDRGGLSGLLRSGSWIAKVSPLAQIFITRLDDLVRIVSRNYEQFSDAVLKVQANAKGKIYEYTAYFRSTETSLSGTPDYYEIIGNVEAGEEAKDDYLNIDVSTTDGTTIKKQVIPEKYEHRLNIDGTSYTRVYSGSNSSVEEVSSGEWKFTVGQSSFSIKAEEISASTPRLVIQVNGDADITVNGDATTTILGDNITTVTGNEIKTIAGNMTVQVAGSVMEVSAGPWTIVGTPTVIP